MKQHTGHHEQLSISQNYFKNTLNTSHHWSFSWCRETAQNAVDAGATQIDYTITAKNKQTIELSVTDNGKGMSHTTLTNDLLTLGSSSKYRDNAGQSKHINTGTSHGYAKNIILFAHSRYQIHSRNTVVKGKGQQYRLEATAHYRQGTTLSITTQTSQNNALMQFRQNCRILAYHYQTPLTITLNGKPLNYRQERFKHQLTLPLCTLSFNATIANDETTVSYWVKLAKLPLFNRIQYSSGRYNIDGILDLNEEASHLLTANHEGFEPETAQLLYSLFNELSHQGSRINEIKQNNKTG